MAKLTTQHDPPGQFWINLQLRYELECAKDETSPASVQSTNSSCTEAEGIGSTSSGLCHSGIYLNRALGMGTKVRVSKSEVL